MAVKYKRKFLVPGDTIKRCRDFRKKCIKKGYRNTGRTADLPCAVKDPRFTNSTYYRRDESRCPFPINKPTDYIVSETLNGEWQCSCPVWKFRRRQCHHIEKAKADPEKYEIAVGFTGRTTDALAKVFGN